MEPFKTRVEPSQTPEIAPQAPLELKSDELPANVSKASDPQTQEERKLDLWEGLSKKRYINEYFDTHNIGEEFMVKMPTSEIDKYIRSELEKLGYEKTIDNYKKVLEDVEEEIGSNRLELFKRLQKITGYIRAVNKLYKAKALKEKYLIPDMPS